MAASESVTTAASDLDILRPPATAESELSRSRNRLIRDLPAVLAVAVIAIVVIMAVFAEQLAPYDPLQQDLRARLQPPFWVQGGGLEHALGTDRLGRDILSRIMYGAQITLFIGLMAVVVGGTIGVVAGVLAGYLGGVVDVVLGRLADIQQAIPFVVLALAVVAALGASLTNLIMVLGVGSWLFYYRVVRGEVLAIRERLFIEASEVIGASQVRIVARHIVPNVAASIIIVVTLFVPLVILFAAGLSFLGLGVPPPTPEWGSMIAEGTQYLRDAWWLSLMPGAFLVLIVLAVNLLGDWMRDYLDPVQRRRM
jgi:peptide/nickel transport system permease protein